MSTPTVVLFDIDGTLIETGGAGARSWRHAFDKLYGIQADIGSHTSAGETDPVVARKTFGAAIGRDPSEDEVARLFATYLLRLSQEVLASDGYRVLEGAEDLLLSLSDVGTTLGIVSGALEGAARVKLSRGNLNRFFIFGGYGSDSQDRAMLTEVAMAKAEMLHGHRVERSRVFVVGDTPLDIAAAKAARAIAVGVATGRFSEDQLSAAGAHHVLASLASPFPTIP